MPSPSPCPSSAGRREAELSRKLPSYSSGPGSELLRQQDATAVLPVSNSGSNVVTMVTAVETAEPSCALKQPKVPSMSQMQTNQSPALSQGNPASVTHSMDGQNNSGDSVFIQSGPAQVSR